MKKILTTLAFVMLGITTTFANAGKQLHTAPTSPASNLTFNNIEGNKMRIEWQNGNGSRRIVIARKTSMVTATPVNGVEYNADAVFGEGSEIAKGTFVVYNGNGNSVTLTELLANSSYYFAVYEYNGTGSSTEYIKTALTGNKPTLAAPSFPPIGVSVSNIKPHSMTLSWNDDLLTGSGRIVLVKADSKVDADPVDLQDYTASKRVGAGSQIGNGNFVIYQGAGNSVTIEELELNTTYHFAIYEFNGTADGKVYNVSKPVRINASNSVKPAKKVAVTTKEK